jgi:uncharacterized RDD family membrane protein YckC
VPAEQQREAGLGPLDVTRLAKFPRRAVGHTIDLLIIISAALLVQIIVGGAQEAQVLSVFLMQLGYNWIFNSLGWSPGKRIRGMRLVTADGEPPGPGRGLTRALVAFVSGFLFIAALGYFWAIWDGKRQTWHDKVAGTYVVTVDDEDVEVRA